MDAGLQSSILGLLIGTYVVWVMGYPGVSAVLGVLTMATLAYGVYQMAAGGRSSDRTERA